MTQRRPAMRLTLVATQPEVELPVANLGFLHALKVGVAVGRVRTLSHEVVCTSTINSMLPIRRRKVQRPPSGLGMDREWE